MPATESEDKLTDFINLIYALGTESFAKDVINNETKRLCKQPKSEAGKPPFRSQVSLELAQMLLTVEPATNSLSSLRKWAQKVDLDAGVYNRNGKYAVKRIEPDTAIISACWLRTKIRSSQMYTLHVL